jgi:hypothetical protein
VKKCPWTNLGKYIKTELILAQDHSTGCYTLESGKVRIKCIESIQNLADGRNVAISYNYLT